MVVKGSAILDIRTLQSKWNQPGGAFIDNLQRLQ
jgi:hypothetical protein